MDIRIDSLDFTTLKLIDENNNYVEIDLRKELSVNEDNIEREMLEQPSKYIYWSSILERLRLFLESSELELEILIGELDEEARTHIEKPTKDSVDAYIKRTEKYKIAKEKCNHYEYLVKRTQFIVKSFEQRKDMLQSYSKKVSSDKIYGHGAGSQLEVDNQFVNNQPSPYNY